MATLGACTNCECTEYLKSASNDDCDFCGCSDKAHAKPITTSSSSSGGKCKKCDMCTEFVASSKGTECDYCGCDSLDHQSETTVVSFPLFYQTNT